MIQITYLRDQAAVHLKGHAQNAPLGHDLVCASVSILAYTLAAFVLKLADKGRAENFTASLLPGEAHIACTPTESERSAVTLVFDSICTGFHLLSEQFPENVGFEVG